MRVLIPAPLLSYTGGRTEIEAKGSTLDEVLRDVDARHPGLRFRVVDEQGAVRPHIRFWVASNLACDVAHPVGASDEVMIVAALSGG